MGKKQKSNDVCYWCGDIPTSKEHIPPKCLFKAVRGNKQLITVPSCAKHNTEKSDLDTYFMVAMGGTLGTLSKAGLTFANDRLSKTAGHFGGNLNAIINPKERVVLNVAGLDFSDGAICEIDFAKISVSIEAIARGLWYDMYKKPFSGELTLFEPIFPAMSYPNGQPQLLNFELQEDRQGQCPEIFWYQFLEKTSLNGVFEFSSEWIDVAILKMCFFNSTTVSVLYNRQGKNRTAAIML